MQKTMPILMTGWFSPSIIERCLNSFSAIEGVMPRIYFHESGSINSNKIKPVICANPNVKGYIQFRDNYLAGASLLAFDHFQENFDEEYMVVTDGDLIISSTSIMNQIKIFEEEHNIGLVSQENMLLGYQSADRKAMQNYFNYTTENEFENFKEVTNSGGCAIMMRTKELTRFRNNVFNRDIKYSTEEPFSEAPQYRPPIWMDLDMSRYVKNVLKKRVVKYTKELCYELTSEEYNVGGTPWRNPHVRPNSEYLKEKFSTGNASTYKNSYADLWRRYANDGNFAQYCHSKYYEGDKDLKYNVIL
jgi:hypothetical protein